MTCDIYGTGQTRKKTEKTNKPTHGSATQVTKINMFMLYANTPVIAVARCLPPKVLEVYAPNGGGCTSTQPDPFSQGSEYIS